MLFEDRSRAVLLALQAGRLSNDSAAFKQLREAAGLWKPAGYDADTSKRRDYYRGDQATWARRDLMKRYPNRHQLMNPYPVPLFKHLIEQQSTIYKAPPRRESSTSRKRDQQLLDRLYSDAAANAHLQAAEEIAVAAGVAFLRVSWDDHDQRVHLDKFWPDKVGVICDPERPDRLDMAHAVVAEVVGAEGVRASFASHDPDAHKRFEVWVRFQDTWSRYVVTDGGKTWAPDDRRYDRLPFVAMYGHRPSGVMFELQPGDDIETNNAIDAMYSDLLFTIQMQGGPQVTYTGRDEDHTIVGGPHTIWSASEGQFGVLNFQPPIASVKETAHELIGQMLVLHGVSPDTASAEPNYQSGVALKVRAQPVLERRQARIPYAREFEELRLFPVMRDVFNAQSGEAIADSVRMLWHPGELQLPLDDEAELRVNQGQVALGMMTVEEMMVKRGLARDLDDASMKRERNLTELERVPLPWGVPFIKSGAVPANVDAAAGKGTQEAFSGGSDDGGDDGPTR